jgi:hypothetical protein
MSIRQSGPVSTHHSRFQQVASGTCALTSRGRMDGHLTASTPDMLLFDTRMVYVATPGGCAGHTRPSDGFPAASQRSWSTFLTRIVSGSDRRAAAVLPCVMSNAPCRPLTNWCRGSVQSSRSSSAICLRAEWASSSASRASSKHSCLAFGSAMCCAIETRRSACFSSNDKWTSRVASSRALMGNTIPHQVDNGRLPRAGWF